MIKFKIYTNTNNKLYVPLIYTVYKKINDSVSFICNYNFINDYYIKSIIDEITYKYNIKNIKHSFSKMHCFLPTFLMRR